MKASMKPPGELRRCQRPALRSGQLDRQRDPVQQTAHPGDRIRVLRADHKAGHGESRPVGKQAEGVGLGERRNLPGHLARYPEHLPARGQQPEPRRGRQQVVSKLRGRRSHMLAVVQDQQPIQAGRVLEQGLGERVPRHLTGAYRGRDGVDNQLRLQAGVQGREPAAASLAVRNHQGQPCLPSATGPEQRQHPGLADPPLHLRQLPLAADKTGQLDRQRPTGRSRLAVLPSRRRHQQGAILGTEGERLGQHTQGKRPRPAAPPPLQGGDSVRAEPSLLRQRLLRQPGRDPKAPQQGPEPCRRLLLIPRLFSTGQPGYSLAGSRRPGRLASCS